MLNKRYMCLQCGYIYDESRGYPQDNIAPGTSWEEVPPAWQCPECSSTKDDFELINL